MPNIEIRGLDQTSARELRHRLFARVFFAKLYYFDLVVEIVPTNVTDGLCNSRPYFYVAYTDEDCEFITEIEDLLANLGDVQMVKLAKFTSSKKELTKQDVFAAIWRRPRGTTARNLASAIYGHEPNPWLRKVLRELVREGVVVKASADKGALYKPHSHGFSVFLERYAKSLPQNPSPEGRIGD